MKEIRTKKSSEETESSPILVKSDETASPVNIEETTALALSSIPVGDLEEIRKFLTERGMAGLHQHLVDKIDQWKQMPVNVAITGQSGSGKYHYKRDKTHTILS